MSNYNNGGDRAPKPVLNQWKGEGIIKARSGNDNDPIRFFPFTNGGGAIHATLVVAQAGAPDPNGQPRIRNTYIPISVMANKNITAEQLQNIQPGTRVRVVGELRTETYTSKKSGQKTSTLVVNAFVFEIISLPQQPYGQQYPPQGGYAPQPMYGGAPQPQYPPQGGYAPQPVYGGAPQPQYPPQAGYAPQQGYRGAPQQQYPPQGGYAPQQGYGGTPQNAAPQPKPAAPAPATTQPAPPPYYRQPAPQQGQAPQGVTTIEDLPE